MMKFIFKSNKDNTASYLQPQQFQALRAEIVQMLYESNTRSLVVSVLVAAILVYIETNVIEITVIWFWSTLFLFAYGSRYMLTIVYFRRLAAIQDFTRWLVYFRIATALCGLTWGMAGYLFYFTANLEYQAFLIFVLVGVSGGAIFVYSIDPLCSYLFVTGLYLMTLPSFLIPASNFSMAMALMLALYIIYVSITGASLARKLRENILLRITANLNKQEINALAQRQRLHLDLTPMGVIEWDSDFRVTSWNAAAEQIFGYPGKVAMHKHINFIVPLSGQDNVVAMMREFFKDGVVKSTQGEYLRSDGKVIYCEWIFTPLKDTTGSIIGLASLVQDKTEFKKNQEEIQFLAYYDLLTNLPNRRLLMDRMKQALIASKRSRSYGAVLFMDLDNFKNLNDMQGHATGDLLLQKVTERLKQTVREKDTISRFGGDEFVLLLENLGSEQSQASDASRLLANKVINAINKPFNFKHHEYRTSASIGICLFLGETLGVSEILKRADIAMFQAKKAGRSGMQFYDESLQPRLEFRASLESDLRGAKFNVELLPYYQIQVNHQKHVTGAELLLRWKHPKHGMISPDEFIPIAEESNLINIIGQSILLHACRQIQTWQDQERTRHLKLSVNISARQFNQDDFVDQVTNALKESGCPPSHLRLELTETLMLGSIDALVNKMLQLKNLGVSLSLDDFGTGYSSLSVLRRFPLDELKLDRSFVANMLHNMDDATIIKTIILMGNNLGMEVIAEGVETAEQATFLRDAGCLNYQGYLYGRPLPVDEFEKQLDMDRHLDVAL